MRLTSAQMDRMAKQVAYCYYHRCDRRDREELIQAARIGLWRALRYYNDSRATKTTRAAQLQYAYAGAHMQVRGELEKILRLHARIAEADFEGEPIDVPDEALGAEEQAIEREDVRALFVAVESLDDLDRYVITKRLEGLVHADIAEGAGCSREWVRRVEARATEALRRALAPTVH